MTGSVDDQNHTAGTLGPDPVPSGTSDGKL